MLSINVFVVISAGLASLPERPETSPCSVSDDLLRGTCLLQTRRPTAVNSKATVEEELLRELSEKTKSKGAVSDGSKTQANAAKPVSSKADIKDSTGAVSDGSKTRGSAAKPVSSKADTKNSTPVIHRLEKIVSEPVLVGSTESTAGNTPSGKSNKTAAEPMPAGSVKKANASKAVVSRSGKSENDSPLVSSTKNANASKKVSDDPKDKEIEDIRAQPEEAHGKHANKFGLPGSRLNETLQGGVMDLTSTATRDKDRVNSGGKVKQQHGSMHLVQQALLGAPLIFMFGSSIAVCGFFAGHQKARAELQAAARARERGLGNGDRRSMMLARPQNSSLLESDDSSLSDGGSCAGLGLQKSSGRGLDLLTSAVQVPATPQLNPVGARGSGADSSSSYKRTGSGFPQPEACSASKALSRWRKHPQHAAAAPLLKTSLSKAKAIQEMHRAFPSLEDEAAQGKGEGGPVTNEDHAASASPFAAPHAEDESLDAEESMLEGGEIKELVSTDMSRTTSPEPLDTSSSVPSAATWKSDEAPLLQGAPETALSSNGHSVTETKASDSEQPSEDTANLSLEHSSSVGQLDAAKAHESVESCGAAAEQDAMQPSGSV
mmetsp:Transcript_85948/g.151784  ORF Transcript_85948/g.151784 Transcript_85948/m.151784 type:complete len:605 (+) Transcript_85948:254-2068(+)